MHAWLCENPVGVDALNWKELPTPTPNAGDVLLEIKAASLNFPDLLIIQVPDKAAATLCTGIRVRGRSRCCG